MSNAIKTGQTTTVQWLSDFFHNAGDGGVWEHFDRDNADTVANALAPLLDARDRDTVQRTLAEAKRRIEARALRYGGEFQRGNDHGLAEATRVIDDLAAALGPAKTTTDRE